MDDDGRALPDTPEELVDTAVDGIFDDVDVGNELLGESMGPYSIDPKILLDPPRSRSRRLMLLPFCTS